MRKTKTNQACSYPINFINLFFLVSPLPHEIYFHQENNTASDCFLSQATIYQTVGEQLSIRKSETPHNNQQEQPSQSTKRKSTNPIKNSIREITKNPIRFVNRKKTEDRRRNLQLRKRNGDQLANSRKNEERGPGKSKIILMGHESLHGPDIIID